MSAPEPSAVPTPVPPAPPAPPTPAPSPAPSFRDSLPTDLRENPAFQDIKDLDGLAKSYVHAQSLLGTNRLQKPAENWQPEQWQSFFREIGAPDSPEGYDLSGVELDDLPNAGPMLEAFKGAFQFANLLPQQAEILTRAYADYSRKQLEAMQGTIKQQVATTTEELQREWGGAFQQKLEMANEAAAAIFGDGLETFRRIQLADGSFLGDNPMMVKLLAAVGDTLGEGMLPSGRRRVTLTADEANAELRALEADTEARAAWLNRDHPRHKEILEKRRILREQANAAAAQPTKDLFTPQL